MVGCGSANIQSGFSRREAHETALMRGSIGASARCQMAARAQIDDHGVFPNQVAP